MTKPLQKVIFNVRTENSREAVSDDTVIFARFYRPDSRAAAVLPVSRYPEATAFLVKTRDEYRISISSNLKTDRRRYPENRKTGQASCCLAVIKTSNPLETTGDFVSFSRF